MICSKAKPAVSKAASDYFKSNITKGIPRLTENLGVFQINMSWSPTVTFPSKNVLERGWRNCQDETNIVPCGGGCEIIMQTCYAQPSGTSGPQYTDMSDYYSHYI
jgi:hypothetical protein